MVLLQAATLKEIKTCYNFQTGCIDVRKLNKRLREVKNRYGPQFEEYLRELLD